jgi:hypothetical protein
MSELKKSMVSDAFWLKTLYLVGFFVVYRVLDLVLLLLTVAQWAFQLISGEPNHALRDFGSSLGKYLAQVVHYLSGASDDKPYPFQDWPDAD